VKTHRDGLHQIFGLSSSLHQPL